MSLQQVGSILLLDYGRLLTRSYLAASGLLPSLPFDNDIQNTEPVEVTGGSGGMPGVQMGKWS